MERGVSEDEGERKRKREREQEKRNGKKNECEGREVKGYR